VTAALLALSALVFLRPADLASVFARDPAFIQRVSEASLPLAALVFTMNLSVALEALVASLGKTKHVLISGLVGSWLGQVPACVLFSKFWRSDIIGRW
jgi:Na+-driven multidrug efflux pump